MRNCNYFAVVYTSCSLCLVACQQYTLDGSIGSSIGVKVTSKSNPGTKAGGSVAALNRVIGSDNSGYVLEEYVGDYGDFAAPATKGAIITADGNNAINATGKTFHMEGWLGEEIITAVNAAPADKENRHFLSEVLTYSGSTWNMSSQNFWRNDIPTTFWSYVDPAEGPKPVFTWPGLPSWRFVNPLSRVSCA